MVAIRNSNSSAEPDFVLKHRIVGAAFLLFSIALFLPWLLGPPTDAKKATTHNDFTSDIVDLGLGSGAAALLAQESEQLSHPERVYISKITPLDSKGGEKGSSSPVLDTLRKPLKENSHDAVDEDKQLSELERVQANRLGKDGSRQREISQSKEPRIVDGDSDDKSSRSTPIVAAANIDVGWVVQVGVFIDKRGAAKVLEDLRFKDFTPSTSIVDTNLGKATGTRIWLGPYAQRVEAAKAKALLNTKTGEAGFIRAYP